MGRAIAALTRAALQGRTAAFLYGCAMVVVLVGVSSVLAWLTMTLLRSLGPVAYVLGGAIALRTTSAIRGLSSAADLTRRDLAECRLDEARASLSALLLLVSGALARLPVGRAWRIIIRYQRHTSSPNAGYTMRATAGLLGIPLEKPGHYCLGEGLREPDAVDIGLAVRIVEWTAVLALIAALGLLTVRSAIAA